MKSPYTGFKRIIKAFGYSLQGFKAAYLHEAAFRQEVWLAIVALPIGYWLASSVSIALWLFSAIFIVLFAELINSAIEAVVDRIGAEYHPLSGRAKDIGSALVFLAIVYFLVVWGVVGWQKYLAIFAT